MQENEMMFTRHAQPRFAQLRGASIGRAVIEGEGCLVR
jgi:hypothetical protein